MPDPISFGELDFNLVSSMKETRKTLEAGTPFHILVMGDFSGRGNRGQDQSDPALTTLQPLLVDRDNFDIILAKLDVEIHLPILGEKAPPVCISFSELDDFHPDTLYQRLDIFQALKDTRKSLEDPATAIAFAEGLLKAPDPESEIKLPEPLNEQSSGDLLDQIIDKTQPDDQQIPSAEPETQWDTFLHDIIKPYLVPKAHPKQTEMINAVDTAASGLMQIILHHKDFQAVEAAWQGINFLVSRLETDDQLKLFLLDITKTELKKDLAATEDLYATAVYKLWVDQAVGTACGQPWSVVAGNYTFEKQNKDLVLLCKIAKIVKAAGTCFLTAAGNRFLCKNSLVETPDPDDWQPRKNQEVEKTWQTLRQMPEAANIGLGLPCLLLRLPYGTDTDPIDAFDFEEMPGIPLHTNYLWGNPCFAIIFLLGQAFSIQGWEMSPGSVLDINSLPLHVYKEKGETRLTPCAEMLLSQRAAEQILDKGLMPLLSFFNQDRIRLARFQSIADPLTRLAGPWD